ncbi:S-layer protein [Natronorubrum tibetense]|uniref:S-layer protein n=1 Tax=Natronorubrum tibetense TaxID=63128 RepID=UPI001F4D1767|nr:S-layer protein [Natronorubrum tibetense]
MVRQSLSRRRFGVALTGAVTIGLAGCSDDDSADDDSELFEPEDPGALTLELENEDGDPVSSGVEVTMESEEEDYTSNYHDDIDDGQLMASLMYEGEYTITLESVDDEFETVEETVTLEEDDETVSVVLDGATPDTADDDEDGEDE